MSVPKGRRKEAYSAYVEKMIELHKLTCDRTSTVPVRYRKMLCAPLNELDSEAYLEILHANELFPKNPEMTEERDGHLRAAYSTILRMQEPLWNFWNVLNFDARRETFWADRINEEIRLILGLLNRGEKKMEKHLIRTISWKNVKEMRFLGCMSDLHRYCYQKIAHVPQRYYDYVSKEIIRCADGAWAEVLKGDTILPKNKSEAQEREKHIRHATDFLNMMQSPLYALWNVESCSERVMDEWAGMLDEELKLLQGVTRADRKRYAGLKGGRPTDR